MKFPHTKQKGMTLVEAMVGIAVISFVFLSLIGAYDRFFAAELDVQPTTKAAYLVEEGIEAVKILRDTSWSSNIASLSTTSTYYLSFATSTALWTKSTTENVIDSVFYRTFTISDLKRDATTKDIVSSGGAYDPDSKQITISVSWRNGNGTSTKSVSTYITNLFSN
jgi:Tfp pilus assembly protein PilV